MTVSSSNRVSGPYTGTGSVATYPFTFKVFAATDLQVIRTNLLAVETTLTLTTDYTVSLNSNQDSNPGGTVTLVAGSLTSGYLLTITSSIGALQQVDFTNQGGFYPAVLNTALDKLTILVQQCVSQLSRAVLVDISSSVTPSALIAQLIANTATAVASAASASTSASNAATSATSASNSASSASTSSATATSQASAASTSATNAAASASSAGTSASSASSSATTATTQASNALTSANSASGSATTATTQASNASTSATNAASSATSAAASAAAAASSAAMIRGLFRKATPRSRLFQAPSATTITTTCILYCEVSGTAYTYASGTSVAMPSLTAGTDYAIYACTDGTIRADSSFSFPSGYTTANSRFIGSAHYAPGGNATAVSGGNTTPAFNPYSLFDLTYRPRRLDWRGMTTDPGQSVCSMIYLLNQSHIANGPSKYNVAIATGSAPPLIPTQFGGTGSSSYANGDWWNLGEVLAAYGMRYPNYQEFAALAYGVTEGTSIGTTVTNSVLDSPRTSACGLIQATGNIDVWGANLGGPYGAAAWTANTDGRGSTYQLSNAVLFGGNWNDGANSGSRFSNWTNAPTLSSNLIGARGVCDLLILD